MARLVLTAVGTYIGYQFGYPQLGAFLGSLAGQALIKDKIQGPKLDDLSAPKLQYGSPWNRVYGRQRVPVIPLWVSDLRAVESTESGKGGGPEITSTTYRLDMLCGLAIDTDAVSYSRVWSNKKLVYNVGPGASAETIAASIAADNGRTEFFDGNPSQLPWDVYEAAVGIGNAPAYRHRVTIGFRDMDVGTGGQPPLIEVEIFTAGTDTSGLYVDNFVDGLTEYTGDLLYFSTDQLEFGPCIQCEAPLGSGGPGEVIQRTIAAVTPSTISILFRYSSVGAGDCGVFVARGGGGSQRFVVTPVREAAFDALRRPHVFLQGEDAVVFASQLSLFTWYKISVTIVAGAGNSTWVLSDATTGSTLNSGSFAGNYSPVSIDTLEFQVDDIAGAGSAQYSQLRMISGAQTIEPVDLADIVTAECERVGLSSGQIDVSDLVGIDVTGFASASATRPTLEQLSGIFYFECFNGGSQIVFRRRGGASAATIAYADTGAGVDAAGEPFNGMDRADELSVPAFYAVTVPDITRDYEPVSVMSDRLVGQSTEVRQIQAAVVMTPSEAKGRADAYARDARVSSHTGEVSLDVAHIERTPTDVITPTDIEGNTYRTRIVRMTFADMVMACELVLDDPTTLLTAGIGPPDGEPAVEVTAPGNTYLELIDGPILRDTDNDAGLYAATRIIGGSGTGSRVFKSTDDVTFTSLGDLLTQATGGTASTALGDTANPYVWDRVNTVTVQSSGELSSSTESAMQADATINLIALRSGSGWEYLRFRTATLVSPGIYTLSVLIRGLRGTEAFIDGHAVGDRFVVLSTSGMMRVPGTSSEIGLERFYKGITLGQPLTSALSIPLSNEAVGLKPFSPVRLRAVRDTSGNITFTWNRRTRLAVRYGGSGGTLAPIGEDSEAYQVDVYDGSDVVRTLSSTTESVAYSAAQQTTDFGGTLAVGDADAEVFQISATVGRGYGHRKSV